MESRKDLWMILLEILSKFIEVRKKLSQKMYFAKFFGNLLNSWRDSLRIQFDGFLKLLIILILDEAFSK